MRKCISRTARDFPKVLVLVLIFSGSDFWIKSTGNKIKNKQICLYQTKKFLIAKKIISREHEKIFANHISDKGLISKIYKELINSTARKEVTR